MIRFIKNRRKGSKKMPEISGPIVNDDSGLKDQKVVLTGIKIRSPEKTDGAKEEIGNGTIPCQDEGLIEEIFEALTKPESQYLHNSESDVPEDSSESTVTVVENTNRNGDNNSSVYATVKKLTPPLSVKAEQLDDRYTPDKEFRYAEPQADPHQEVRELLKEMSAREEEDSDDNMGPLPKVDDYYIYVTEETLKNASNGVNGYGLSSFSTPDEEMIPPMHDMYFQNGQPNQYQIRQPLPFQGRQPNDYEYQLEPIANGREVEREHMSRLPPREDQLPRLESSRLDPLGEYQGRNQEIRVNHSKMSEYPNEKIYPERVSHPDRNVPPEVDQAEALEEGDRPGRGDRPSRGDQTGRGDKPGRGDQTDRGDQPGRGSHTGREPGKLDQPGWVGQAMAAAAPQAVKDNNTMKGYRTPPEHSDETDDNDQKDLAVHFNHNDPRSEAYLRQMSAPTHPGVYEEYMRREEPYYRKRRHNSSSPYQHEATAMIPGPRDDWGQPGVQGYESDRSDHENYYRSYDRRRRRKMHEVLVRRSPSGGFIERTHSMPAIKWDHYRYGHPRHRYGYPYHERDYRRRPSYERYRDNPHRPMYKEGYGHATHPRSKEKKQKASDDKNGPKDKRAKRKVEGSKNRASPEESGSSFNSNKPGKRQEQKVSFKRGETKDTAPETTAEDREETDVKSVEILNKQNGKEGTDVELNENTTKANKPSRKWFIRRSIAICFAWLCMGFYTEVVGPNIPYLQSRINGTMADIALSLAARGVGLVLGAIVGGLLCEFSPKWLDLWISFSLILGALCASAVPWSLNMIHLCLTLGLSGFSKGFLQVATVTMALRLWAARGFTIIIFLIHVAYAIGAAPCAQLAYLFDAGILEQLLLGSNHSMATHPNHHQPETNGHSLVLADAVIEEQAKESSKEKILNLLDYIPRPMYPFDIAAVLTFVCGAVFLVFFGSSIRSVAASEGGKMAPEEENESKETSNDSGSNQKPSEIPPDEAKPGKWFLEGTCGLRAFMALIVFFLLPMAILAIFGGFHHLYIMENLDQKLKSEALLIQTVFWASVAVGRFLAMLSANCLAPNGTTITCLTVSIVSTALMWVYGDKYRIFIWVFTVLLGLSTGPMLPAGLTLCNICIGPNAIAVAAVFLLQAIGDGLFSWTAGFILHILPSVCLMYVGLASVGLSFLLYLPIIPLLAKANAKKKTPRHKNKVHLGKPAREATV